MQSDPDLSKSGFKMAVFVIMDDFKPTIKKEKKDIKSIKKKGLGGGGYFGFLEGVGGGRGD